MTAVRCDHCGDWTLDDDGLCATCRINIDPHTSSQRDRNLDGIETARAALKAVRVRRGNPADPDPSNLWAVHRGDDVGAGDG